MIINMRQDGILKILIFELFECRMATEITAEP